MNASHYPIYPPWNSHIPHHKNHFWVDDFPNFPFFDGICIRSKRRVPGALYQPGKRWSFSNAKPSSWISSSFKKNKIWSAQTVYVKLHIHTYQSKSNHVKLCQTLQILFGKLYLRILKICLPPIHNTNQSHPPFQSTVSPPKREPSQNTENATRKNRTWPASACVQDSLGHLPICLGRIEKSKPQVIQYMFVADVLDLATLKSCFLSICCCPVLFSVKSNSFQEIEVGPSFWEWAISINPSKS